MNRAVFLDRDGTLVFESRQRPARRLRLFAGAAPRLSALARAGWKLILVTNQSWIGRGELTLRELRKMHLGLRRELERSGVKLDEILVCPHLPSAGCPCRKPRPGLLKQAARKFRLRLSECVLVGDQATDVEAARAAGAGAVLVLTGQGARAFSECAGRPGCAPDFVAENFAQAADWILRRTYDRSG